MELNLPPKVRQAVYIIVVLGTSIMLPLHVASLVSDPVMAVWTSVSGAASFLAAINVNTK